MLGMYDLKLSQSQNVNIVEEQLKEFIVRINKMWWETDSSFYFSDKIYTGKEHRENEKSTNNFVKRLVREFEFIPKDEDEHKFWLKNIKNLNRDFAKGTLGLPDNYLKLLFMDGFTKSTTDFLKEVKSFNSEINIEDTFQAIRNVWIMNGIQFLLGREIEYTPSIFAYSMLYPYTDNYLDDENIPLQTKLSFNKRFGQRLSGEPIKPLNSHELEIYLLVNMIENQYPRESFPEVYEALLGIHEAQNESLLQQDKESLVYEKDILGISIKKGGMSVLADAYLVKGSLIEREAEFMFNFGVILQLADDLQDVRIDMANGHMTIFSQLAAASCKLDSITSKLLNFISKILDMDDYFNNPKQADFKDLIKFNCRFLILQSIAKNKDLYSKEFIKIAETYSQYSFKYLKGLYDKLKRDYYRLNKRCKGFDYNSIFEVKK